MKRLDLLNMWHRFWFSEQPATPISLYRIFFGLLVLQVSLVEILPNFYYFYGMKAITDTPSVVSYWAKTLPYFDVFLLGPQTDSFRVAVFVILILAALCLTLGLGTRISAILVYIGLLSLHRQCPTNIDAGDNFMRLAAFILCFSHCGDEFSLDKLISDSKSGKTDTVDQRKLSQPWAQRLLQVQMAIAYWHSFICKVQGSQWQDGTAIYGASRMADFIKFPFPPFMDNMLFSYVLTYYTLAIEFALFTLVWFKPFRYWVLLGGLFLHLGIEYTMNLPGFELLFVATYINFIEPKDLDRAIEFCKQLLQKAWHKSPLQKVSSA